jgi:sec-independent protein translocase protein TatB
MFSGDGVPSPSGRSGRGGKRRALVYTGPMLGIGTPEFMIIAVVALIVLGPERLPEVMRKVGQFYRQARELATQYTTEAQRMFDEGMREVEEVGTTINSAWQGATTENAPNEPPPKLRQLPPPARAAATAADAGPWVLPATGHDTATDLEPLPATAPASPTALPRPATVELITLDWPAIDGPVTVQADLPAGPAIVDWPARPASSPRAPVPTTPEAPGALGANGAAARSTSPDGTGAATEGATPAAPATASSNGQLYETEVPPADLVPDMVAIPGAPVNARTEPEPEGSIREQTVLDLYLQGGVNWQKAAAFLGLSPEEFLNRLERVRRSRAAQASAQR